MMTAYLKIGMASALALATAAPAYAQYYRPTPEYQRQYQDYESQRRQYENSREAYQDARQDYAQARRDYELRLREWERQRLAYDARYGYGAYARVYPRPVWDEAYWAASRAPYDYRAPYADGYRAPYGDAYRAPYAGEYRAPYAGRYGSNANASYANVRCDNNSTVAAGAIGALLGGILGSNVAARNARTEGTVLGAVVGGAIGAGVGRANDRYRCDQRGPYLTYSETLPYRESRSYRYGQYDTSYYTRQRCRLAPAPVDPYATDYRYVRVCPDETGRYRFVA